MIKRNFKVKYPWVFFELPFSVSLKQFLTRSEVLQSWILWPTLGPQQSKIRLMIVSLTNGKFQKESKSNHKCCRGRNQNCRCENDLLPTFWRFTHLSLKNKPRLDTVTEGKACTHVNMQACGVTRVGNIKESQMVEAEIWCLGTKGNEQCWQL